MQRAFLIGVFLLALVAPPLHADCPMFAKLATVENVSGRTPISLDETKLLESLSQQGKIFAAPDFCSYLEKNQALAIKAISKTDAAHLPPSNRKGALSP